MKSRTPALPGRPGNGANLPGENLARLRNLGAASAEALEAVGIRTRTDLAAVGAIGACERLFARGRRPSLNLAYAIEGALMDFDWKQLPWSFREPLARDFRCLQHRNRLALKSAFPRR